MNLYINTYISELLHSIKLHRANTYNIVTTIMGIGLTILKRITIKTQVYSVVRSKGENENSAHNQVFYLHLQCLENQKGADKGNATVASSRVLCDNLAQPAGRTLQSYLPTCCKHVLYTQLSSAQLHHRRRTKCERI